MLLKMPEALTLDDAKTQQNSCQKRPVNNSLHRLIEDARFVTLYRLAGADDSF